MACRSSKPSEKGSFWTPRMGHFGVKKGSFWGSFGTTSAQIQCRGTVRYGHIDQGTAGCGDLGVKIRVRSNLEGSSAW